MPRPICCAFECLLGLVFVSLQAHAGALFPCISATMSASSSTLVVNELTFDDPKNSHGQMPRSSAFRVLRRYVDPNEGLRLNGPDTSWVGPLWSVIFNRADRFPAICPYVLVTDDAEFLIFVGSGFGPGALTIYRRRDHPGRPFGGSGPDHGVLVRKIPLTDLWPPERIPTVMTDESPQWFAGGTFRFSSDNRMLIYKTQWGNTLEIKLATGIASGK